MRAKEVVAWEAVAHNAAEHRAYVDADARLEGLAGKSEGADYDTHRRAEAQHLERVHGRCNRFEPVRAPVGVADGLDLRHIVFAAQVVERIELSGGVIDNMHHPLVSVHCSFNHELQTSGVEA